MGSIKWKSNHFSNLEPFDILSLEDILKRTKNTMLDIDRVGFEGQYDIGRSFIKFTIDNDNDPEVKYFHKKFNGPKCPLPTKEQIILHQYKPQYTRPEYHTTENMYIFDQATTNVNGRDGFINGGFSEVDIWAHYIDYKRKNKTTGEWIYLELPYEYVFNYMDKSINNAPLLAAKKFIEEIDNTIGWDDKEGLKSIVEKYDLKHPNWNHDFPVASFIDVKKNGIFFPCQWWNPEMLAGNGTHRMVMSGYNKMNIPYVTQVPPWSPFKWYSQSRFPIFCINGKYQYLVATIDRIDESIEYFFTEDRYYATEKNRSFYE